jgi:hypothetical protein
LLVFTDLLPMENRPPLIVWDQPSE